MIKSSSKLINTLIVLIITFSVLCGGLIYTEFFFAVAAAVFVVLIFLKGEIHANTGMLSILAGGLILGVVMLFVGINREKSVVGVAEAALYVAVFFIFSSASDGKALVRCIMRTLVWSCVFCFGVNLAALAYGVLPVTDGGRVFSLVIPYSNTLGILFASSALWCLYEKKNIYSFVHVICLLGMFLTQSTGSLAVYFATAMLYLLINKKYVLFCVIAAPAVVLGVLIFVHGSFSGFSERVVYYFDSINIFLDFPFGIGKGGWSSIYTQYQSGVYAAENVHSSLFQTMVDYGFLGLCLYAGAGLILTRLCIAAHKHDKEHSQSIMIICLGLFVHSITDADFCFPLVILLLIGLSVSLAKECESEKFVLKSLSVIKIPSLCMAVLCAILSVSYFSYVSGYDSYRKGELREAECRFKTAVRLNPASASGYYMLYQLTGNEHFISEATELDDHNPVYYAAMAVHSDDKENALLAVLERQPYNTVAYDRLFELYYAEGDRDKIISLEKRYNSARKKLLSSGFNLRHNSTFVLSENSQIIINKQKELTD